MIASTARWFPMPRWLTPGASMFSESGPSSCRQPCQGTIPSALLYTEVEGTGNGRRRPYR